MKIFALATMLACVALNARGTEANAQQLIGKPRPEFALFDATGEVVSIDRWDGKIIVLNFWATWCAPCRKEIPMLNALQKEYAARGVQFIGVAVDNATAVEKFLQQIPIDYVVMIGEMDALELIARYGDTAGTLPYTAFIDRKGIIRALAGGALTESYTRQTLHKLINAN